MNQQNIPIDWGQEIANQVGERVRMYRAQLNLSAQNLANRTAVLGYEVKRSVIAEMENGKRTTVSVADVFVLARALAVPPVALLLPLEAVNSVALLPKEQVDVWSSYDWITGRQPLKRVPSFLIGEDAGGQVLLDVDESELERKHWKQITKPMVLRFRLESLTDEFDKLTDTAEFLSARAKKEDSKVLADGFERKANEFFTFSQQTLQNMAEVVGQFRELGIPVENRHIALIDTVYSKISFPNTLNPVEKDEKS